MKENYKKNRNRKRFSCFFNNTTKGRTFQFLMTISMPARPPAPFKPLRMNVNRHYYIKTKAGKITSLPNSQKKKCVTSKNLTTKDKNEHETALTFDRAALKISCALIRDDYEVQKFSWVDLLCLKKTM